MKQSISIRNTCSALAVIVGLSAFGGVTGFGAASADEGVYGPPSPWQVRVRALAVVPEEDADITVIGGTVDIDNSIVPEIDITYFVTDHFALELILATTPHEVEHSSGLDLGSSWLLPPTLTAQYHFNPKGKWRPYVGAGVNYTFFYNIDEPKGFKMDYENGWGYALQAGIDIQVTDDPRWFLNFDVKKVWIDTEVDITVKGTPNTKIKADVDINPWLFGVGFGYRF